ncbi:hypothetical protein GBA52_023172 [Prunus armeniaca]|nr:hypothetical protein GBA52_023172 [Prunus armeniaca]
MAKQICAFFFCFWWVLFCLGHIANADDPVTISSLETQLLMLVQTICYNQVPRGLISPRMGLIFHILCLLGGSAMALTALTILTEVVPLEDQIQQFATVRGNLTELIGPEATDKFLAKSLFIISIGSNDLFDHVELPSNSSTSVDPEDEFFYMTNLQFTYHNHLEV